jgi:UDP-glucose 4-epimerase
LGGFQNDPGFFRSSLSGGLLLILFLRRNAMKILVTGGCGFIASHIADAYIAEGHDVAIVDNLSTGKEANKPRDARLHRVDICNAAAMDKVFAAEKPDFVNHHAAQISVPLSVQDPVTDAEVNIKGTLQLLELARRYSVKKVVFASTGGAIYGEATKVPTDEEYPPQPASPYAIAKFSVENYLRFYRDHHGLDFTVLRYSNVYGPRQIPHGEAGVVAIFTEAILNSVLPTVNHFADQPDGMIRDYCYVKDIAAANMIATGSGKTGVFNVGTGKGTSTFALYRMILASIRKKGIDVPPEFDFPKTADARGGDIRVSTLNAGRARQVLGFEARYGLEEGLSETVDWYLAGR